MLEKTLEKHFFLEKFRTGQREIIESILAGRDTLAIMPTGAGKSLCFQLPAVTMEGLTIVVSPLVALMKNQVDGLSSRGIGATFLNSSISAAEQQKRTEAIEKGKYKLLYLAPERFSNESFMQWFVTLPICLFAIDEAHCISSWGHDFRPEYQQIAKQIARIPKRPVVAAFTATATSVVVEDIQTRLKMQKPKVFVGGFDRPNLQLFVREKLPLNERYDEALRIVKSINGAGIIYTLTIKDAEEVTNFLIRNDIKAAVYHAKLDSEKRSEIQDAFMENEYQVVVATVAFGMGVDKADIRFVIHVGMPPNLERYYQEAGRAGRDGERAFCIILHNGRDTSTHNYFIQLSQEKMVENGKSKEEIREQINLRYRQLEAMQDYVETKGCRRKIILGYFNDPKSKEMEKCGSCDMCLDFKWEKAPTRAKITKKIEGINDLSNTVMETVKLYENGKTFKQIAKIRSLGGTTIVNHIATWYGVGGNFDYEKYVTPKVEGLVFAKVKLLGKDKLGPIKTALPRSVSYDQIRFVIARIQRSK